MGSKQGFTLLELMITLAIVAIMLAMAVPGFSAMMRENAIHTSRDDLFRAFRFARDEASKRATRVSICALTAGSNGSCDTSATSWDNGWIVFVDDATKGKVDTGDEILSVYQNTVKRADYLVKSATVSKYHVSFSSSGRGEGFELWVCDEDKGVDGKGLRVYLTGNVQQDNDVSCN